MTKIEELLNRHFGTKDCNMEKLLRIISKDNPTREDLYQETANILVWLNSELEQ